MIKQELLLEGLKTNQKEAIDQIYTSCFSMIKNHIIKNNGSEENSQDIFQEAIIVLYQKLVRDGNFFLTCSISSYLFEISKRLWLKHLAQNNKTIRVNDDNINFISDKVIDIKLDIEEHHQHNKKLLNLKNALELLGEPCSSLIKAFYNDNKNMGQITEIFGYNNENSAKNQKYKCLLRLRKIFFKTFKSHNNDLSKFD